MEISTQPPDAWFGTWQGEDGRLCIVLTRPDASACAALVSVFNSSGRCLYGPSPATFRRHSEPSSRLASQRLDQLICELGSPGLGTTLHLLVSIPNAAPSTDAPLWVTAPMDALGATLVMHLDQGASFYEAVLGRWDDAVEAMDEDEGGWLRPYCPYRLVSGGPT